MPASQYLPLASTTVAIANDPEARQHDTIEGGEAGNGQGGVIQNVGGVGGGGANPAGPTEERKPTVEEIQDIGNILEFIIYAFCLPLVVGIFAVLSVEYAATSNDQSQVANQIALLALCYSNSVGY